MKIEIRLFASLAHYGKSPLISSDNFMEWPEEATVADLVDALSVPREDIKIIFINGVHAKLDDLVRDGDRVGIFPPVGGG